MAELERLWTTAWTWLVANATVERSSVVISLIAILIAYRSARHAKRGVRAAEAQAAAAAEQVEVAKDQLFAAQVDSAERIAEVSALTSYRDYFETHSAKIAVALEPTLFPPKWERERHGLPRKTEDGPGYPVFNKGENVVIFDEEVNEYDDILYSKRPYMQCGPSFGTCFRG
ncbi:hypothetical protein [Nonomuraea sp. NPDC049646]|uniref:hypothetical protein n=1 Tax=unclassified Nonomuraea TaxID=2593643 RepID=UPI003796E94A